MSAADDDLAIDREEVTAVRPAGPVSKRFDSRFTPGSMLANRYRIVALLGSGGMGEVYRAEDLKLGQQVALKFLPHAASSDPRRLERLYAEVRLGRQVSHPNVCRLYDVGEWEGNHFLAMEYVDGEDLASLLRRIGKLPHDKALDITRDLCAGIAAAHRLGIIHRDLKPANIMIDGRGSARITDFGLAAVAEELAGRREIAGTPLYMAPEQLSGGEATQKTDVYSLGLILYEMFTGHRLFESATAGDSSSRRSSTTSHSISTETRELDPAIRRVILRCLEEDPQARPSSIHAVIVSLPGGDPLQAALDAGETPSPEMVAAAGAVGDLQPATAWTLLALAVIGFITVAVLIGRVMLFHRIPLPKPPEVLIERATTILEKAGYTDPPAGSAHYFSLNEDFFRYARESDRSPDRWKRIGKLRPGIFMFGYRQSPRPLVPANQEGHVTQDDPPMTVPGMAEVWLDPQGRLLSFTSVPPQITPAGERPWPDWPALLAEAGGDFDDLRSVEPRWAAPVASDQKVAWEGFYRGESKVPIRIEAAAQDGRPVWFKVIGPWERPANPKAAETNVLRKAVEIVWVFLGALSLVGSVYLARRNVRRGRGDRVGAPRLAFFVFSTMFIGYLFRADHVSAFVEEWNLLERGLAFAALAGIEVWLLYLALEPYVRRRWPHALISWRRLLAGRVRDPMVGRDLLIGTVGGLVIALLRLLTVEAPKWFGGAELRPLGTTLSPLIGTRHLVYIWFVSQIAAMFIGFTMLFLLFVLYVVLRRRVLAMVGLAIVIAVVINGRGEAPGVELAFGALMAVLGVTLIRFGLLSGVAAAFVDVVITASPITLDPSAWYFGRSLGVLIALLAITVYGFYTSLGGKPLFVAPALED